MQYPQCAARGKAIAARRNPGANSNTLFMSTTPTSRMSGTTETANSEDLQSLYNAVLQGFANEEPEPSPRVMASPASDRSSRPLPAVPRVAQSVYGSIPPPPPMPTNKRYAMPEPAPRAQLCAAEYDDDH